MPWERWSDMPRDIMKTAEKIGINDLANEILKELDSTYKEKYDKHQVAVLVQKARKRLLEEVRI
jgi:hypothetical protein